MCARGYTRSGHALESYLSQETRMGRLLGDCRSADKEEQHAQSEVGETHHIDALNASSMQLCGNASSMHSIILSICKGYVKHPFPPCFLC